MIEELQIQRKQDRAQLEAEIARTEPPAEDDPLPPGKILEWPELETVAMARACQASDEPLVHFTVHLDEHAEPTQVEVTSSSKDEACDQALRDLVLAASWQACEELGLQAPCTVHYAISLPSKYHQPLGHG